MITIPAENFNFPLDQDKDVLKSWSWFISLFSEVEWQKRKLAIEQKIVVPNRIDEPFSETLDKGTLLVIKDDQIGWYLYLTEMFLKQPYKYEFFQGARVIPIFKRFGQDFDLLMGIEGIKRKVKNLIKVRKSEADAILFEILTALVWERNGWKVSFLDESKPGKTPDLFAKKGNKEFYIECKRQMKTADYTYRETMKRQVMISHLNKDLMKSNLLLDIVFHVELETLPDTYLKDLLMDRIPEIKESIKITDKDIVDIDVSFVDINGINEHLKENLVKYNSPQLNFLIGRRASDNVAFTSGIYASFIKIGEGEINNKYVDNLSRAFGVFWQCDAIESIAAKARDIKKQLYSALEQFQSGQNIVIHIGMETYDGPEVEVKRLQKITETLESLQLNTKTLKWAYCHFFQSYSTPEETWVFDETVNIISSVPPEGLPPLANSFLIIPEDVELQNMAHWEKPLP
tara:strand:- start:8013 stop:9389 length:1377 start_codon:yes stop_codon:yes gene_type:complete